MSKLLDELRIRSRTPSDINEHLQELFALAMGCDTIVEFGVRTGNSTVAFLAGLEAASPVGGKLHSYDIEDPQAPIPWPETPDHPTWYFYQRDTAHLGTIPACDLLFIDTAHTRVHVAAELQYHASVRKYIVFHDTVLWGVIGMDGKTGVLHAALDFMAAHPEWELQEHRLNCNGLLILKRKVVTP